MGSIAAIDEITKYAVARPRPPVSLRAVVVDGDGFPPGHAIFSALVILLCSVLLTHQAVHGRWPRLGPWVGAVALIAAVGSRVFLAAQ